MKIIVTAGGTGGHIYPALAIINKFKEKDPATEVIYVGTHDRMEKDIVPKYGIKYIPIKIYGFSKTKIFRDIYNIKLIEDAEEQMTKLMMEFKPDYVIGTGGYVTFPVIKAAKFLGIKSFIHEQNAIPGKTNKALAKCVNIVGVSFKEATKYFKNVKVIYCGNPTGEMAIKAKEITKKDMGLDPLKKLVVIVAGSLGSKTINEKMKVFLKGLDKKSYQVLYITGKDYFMEYGKEIYPSNVKVVPYVENLSGLLKNTDLMVTRAGASTIAEIIALKVPSIFIPSPYVANNHQYYNALELKDDGCGEMLEEKDFSAEKLTYMIDELMVNQTKYQSIKDALEKKKTIESSEMIYNHITGNL